MKNGWLISSGSVLIVMAIWGVVSWVPKLKKTDQYWKKVTGFCVNEICLTSENKVWRVKSGKTNRRADHEKVEPILRSLEAAKLEQIASNNPQRFGDFGIGGSEKVMIEMEGKKLEIGNMSNNYDGVYVREENGQVVYNIPGNIDKKSITTIEYWGMNQVLNLPKYQVKKVTIERGGKKLELEPKNNQWENEALVNELFFLRGKYVPEIKPEWTKGYHYTIDLETTRNELWVTSEKLGKTNHYYISDDQQEVWEIEKEVFNKLTAVKI